MNSERPPFSLPAAPRDRAGSAVCTRSQGLGRLTSRCERVEGHAEKPLGNGARAVIPRPEGNLSTPGQEPGGPLF